VGGARASRQRSINGLDDEVLGVSACKADVGNLDLPAPVGTQSKDVAGFEGMKGHGSGGSETLVNDLTGTGIESAGDVYRKYRRLVLQPGFELGWQALSKSSSKEGIDYEIDIANGCEGVEADPFNPRPSLGFTGWLSTGLVEGVNPHPHPPPPEVPGGDQTITTVVARPGQHSHPGAITRPHPDRGSGHRPPGSIHQNLDWIGRLLVEPDRLGRRDDGLHLLVLPHRYGHHQGRGVGVGDGDQDLAHAKPFGPRGRSSR
jgi:hypothetical protein